MPLVVKDEYTWWKSPGRRLEVAGTVALFLLALLLRLSGNAAREPTLGEMAASLASVSNLWEVFTGPQSEQCPPLLWILLWPASWLGEGALEIQRIWLAVISAFFCAALYPIFRGILKPSGAAVAAVILSIHPAAVLAGRTVGPEALVIPAFLLGIYGVLRTTETTRLKHWIILDVALVLLITSHRGAVVAAAGLFLVHGAMVFARFVSPRREAWATRRRTLATQFALHYGLSAIMSLPLAVLILRNPIFPVDPFDLAGLGNWLRITAWGGTPHGPVMWIGPILCLGGWILVIPGFVALMAKPHWRNSVGPLSLVAIVLITFLISFAPGGFKFTAAGLAGLTTAGLALGVGTSLGYARRPVRLSACLLLAVGWLASGMPNHNQPLPIRATMHHVRDIRQTGEPILVWPPYLSTALEYYFGTSAGSGDLAGFLSGIQEPDPNIPIHVVLIRWPNDNARTITLRGALSLHSAQTRVWRASPLTEVVTVNGMNRQGMAAWNADPRTLDTDDKPVPKLTMFQWLPTSDLFAKSPHFHQGPADALFEPSGRRVVWTAREEVELRAPVSLPQGSYFVKVHCAPSPEDGPAREVEVVLSAYDRLRFVVDKESTLSLPFTTAADLDVLPIRIQARPLMKVGQGAETRRQGLKIYSISVEPPAPFP